jgi:hypothetical protein
MCNLYSLHKKRDMVARYFRVSHSHAASYQPATSIALSLLNLALMLLTAWRGT